MMKGCFGCKKKTEEIRTSKNKNDLRAFEAGPPWENKNNEDPVSFSGSCV